MTVSACLWFYIGIKCVDGLLWAERVMEGRASEVRGGGAEIPS